MIIRDFLIKILEQIPSRGLDNTEIYIYSENEDCSYKIINIDNDGYNDAVFINIEKIK